MNLKINEKNIKRLGEFGYLENENRSYKPVEFDEDGFFCAIKTNHKKKIAIQIDYVDGLEVKVYRYKGEEMSHTTIKYIKNIKPYIQELIDNSILELVE